MTPAVRWLRRILFLGLGLATLYAAARWSLGAYANGRLESELQALRDAGEPLTLAEFEPPPVAEATNAAPLIVEAGGLVAERSADVTDAWSWFRDDPYLEDADVVSGVETWVQVSEPALELLERALLRPHCRLVADWSQAGALKLEAVGPLNELRTLLHAKGLLEARSGRPDAAARTAESILRLSSLLREEPVLMVVLQRQALRESAVRVIEWTLRGHALSRETLDRTRAALSRTQVEARRRELLQAELAYGSSVFYESLRTPQGLRTLMMFRDLAWYRDVLLWLFPEAVIRLDHARWLARSREGIALADRPWLDVTTNGERRAVAPPEADPWYAIASSQASWLSGFLPKRMAVHASRCLVLDLALDIEEFAVQHGTLPEDLSALGTETSRVDPASGLPFRYERTDGGRGYRLHGAGPDGVFADDLPDPWGKARLDTDDIGFVRPARG